MNKKNCVFGVVFVMMMVFGLMAMVGCPTEDGGNDDVVDPSGGKTVAEKYWGTYTRTSEGGRTDTVILTEKKLVDIITISTPNSQNEFQAWTDGTTLYYYYEKKAAVFGTFTTDTSFKTGTNRVYIKQN